jgi:predicted amidohydrolase
LKDAVKVGIVQPRPEQNVDPAVENALVLTEEVAGDSDLVVMPESWVLFDAYPAVQTLCDAAERILERFGKLAQEFGIHIIPGALYEALDNRRVISCPLIGTDGQIQGRQLKTHLFRDKERELFHPGDSYEIFDIGICRLGIMVCYDAVFPEVARILALRGADLTLNPSRILSPGISPWQLYLKTRCLENRMPIVAANVSWPPIHNGGSLAIQPVLDPEFEIVHPQVMTMMKKNPEAKTVTLDISTAAPLRRKRLQDRAPETYRELYPD